MNFSVRFSDTKPLGHVIAKAIACTILLVLPGCGIPDLRLAQPGPCLPEDFNGATSPDNSSQLGIEEFYDDRMLTCLIEKALADNRELKALNEDVAIAGNEVLSRSGAYLPFVSVGAGAGLDRASRFTEAGAGILTDPYLPGKFFSLAHGNFGTGINFTWQLDIYRQLRDARDAAAQRYVVASERRNFFVTRLVADIAETYYRLMALDKRIENLDQIIGLQQRSLDVSKARREFARGNALAILRFQAEVQRYQSEKLTVNQQIIEGENRINYLVNRFPQRVERASAGFYDLTIHPLSVGVPSQLLQNRPDIREAEREVAATGLDVRVARINFYPQVVLNGGTGLNSFVINHLFEPQAVIGNVAGSLVGPLVNRRAIQAQYLTANARQLQAIYNYQRIILNAFTEVINRVTMTENYGKSVDIKKQQLKSLEDAVRVAGSLFQAADPQIEYIDVISAQEALQEARVALIEDKTQQLAGIVNTYQALGGGVFVIPTPEDFRGKFPYTHTVRGGENFWTISLLYYRSGRYGKALWTANKDAVPDFDRLAIGEKIIIPPPDRLDRTLIEDVPAPAPRPPEMAPAEVPAIPSPLPPPPPASMPSPFGRAGSKDHGVKVAGSTNHPAAPADPSATGK